MCENPKPRKPRQRRAHSPQHESYLLRKLQRERIRPDHHERIDIDTGIEQSDGESLGERAASEFFWESSSIVPIAFVL